MSIAGGFFVGVVGISGGFFVSVVERAFFPSGYAEVSLSFLLAFQSWLALFVLYCALANWTFVAVKQSRKFF